MEDIFVNMPVLTPFKELHAMRFEYIAKLPNIINEDNENIINQYLSLLYDTKNKEKYVCNPHYNSGIKSNKYRFLLIQMPDNDVIFWCYKVIRIVKTQQIRFLDLPISKCKNMDNVLAVMQSVKSLHFVRFIFQERFLKYFDNSKATRHYESDEFFFLLNQSKYMKNSWKRKRGITFLKSNEGLSVVDFPSKLKNNVFELYNSWKENMPVKVSPTDERYFRKFITDPPQGVEYITVESGGKLISLQVFLVDKCRGIVECVFAIHLWKHENELIQKNIIRNMSNIQKYLAWERYHGQVDIFWYGTAMGRLRKHKEMCCDGFIKYYIV